MKKTAALFVVIAIIAILLFVVYKMFIKPNDLPTSDPVPAAGNLNLTPTNIAQPSTVTPETLAKIQVVCMASSTKAWFENTYQTKCSKFGF